jgi:threonine dehydratase
MGGSFKIRGSIYKIQAHLNDVPGKGIVAVSVGNHAQGVSIAVRVFIATWVSFSKQEATKSYGVEVVLEGNDL